MGNLTSETLLVIDLDTGDSYEEMLDEEFYQTYIGGAAANLALYNKYIEGDPVILGTGLLTGTLVPGSSAGIITGKSPRTDKVCHASFNLYGGLELKYTGFDFVVIKGIAKNPSYLWLHDSIADIKDASGYWGKDAWETTDTMRADLGEDLIQVLTIGEAGEKKSDLAQVILNYWSTGDKWGFGSVLGKKNIKAIAMRGMGLFDMEDEDGFLEGCHGILTELKSAGLNQKEGILSLSKEVDNDITKWVSPLLHRHSTCYNCTCSLNSFLKFDDDPKIMEETDVQEPGILVTDINDLLSLKKLGLPVEETAKLFREILKFGLDPIAVAELCIKNHKNTFDDIKSSLNEMNGPVESTGAHSFTPCLNGKPVYGDFSIADDNINEWWVRRQAVAYIFGIHPVFSLMAPPLSETRLLDLVNIGTGFGISQETLDSMIETL